MSQSDADVIAALRDIKGRTHLGVGPYLEESPMRQHLLRWELIINVRPRGTRASYGLTEKGERLIAACNTECR